MNTHTQSDIDANKVERLAVYVDTILDSRGGSPETQKRRERATAQATLSDLLGRSAIKAEIDQILP